MIDFSSMGLGELLIILIIIVLIFGPRKMAKLFKSIEESGRELKKEMERSKGKEK